jgi:hypothetical protein
MNENGTVMPVVPYGSNNDGMFGGNGAWWIIILLAVLGWGNGFGGGFGGNGGGGFFNADMQRGFDHSAVVNGINGVQASINGVQNALCNGFAGVNQGVANGFAQAEIAANARQMADMNQQFALQSALQQCCCDNRAATADLKYTMATEAAATRVNSDANSQKILDKLCQLELDGVKGQLAQAQRDNVALQNQLNMANLAASQTAQNAFIQQGFSNEVDALYNRLNSCPVPTTPVYGRTPIFSCNNNGCGCNAGFAG